MLAVISENPALYLSGALVLGLIVGSFLNVVILRLPARLEHDWQCQCRELLEIENPEASKTPPDLVFTRSHCTSCGHVIRAHENIPLLSYLILRARCSACGTRISARYPLIELATGLLFLVTALQFGPTIQSIAALGLTAVLIALTGIDADTQLLPDNITLPLLWAGLLLSLFNVFTDPVSSIIGAIAGYMSLWSIYQLFRVLTGKEGMGHGDFKLMGALGAWMGWQMLPLVILLSSLVGAIIGLLLMALKRHEKGSPMPFGPFIAAAGWIALIWGDELISGYLRYSGLG